MKNKDYTIRINNPFHARPVSIFISAAEKYTSEITVKHDSSEYNGKSILNMMSINPYPGDIISICVDGIDEGIAFKELDEILNQII